MGRLRHRNRLARSIEARARSQAVSGDFVLEKLLETLMRTAIEQSGAVRWLPILSRDAGPRIVAEAMTDDTIATKLRDEPLTATALPQSVVHSVLRSRECYDQPPFTADPYIGRRQARSVLCMPLLNQGQLIGVLYLENNLTPRIFAPARITVLKLLAAQAAISLENTRLYRDLAEREAKIGRLVDANIIGIVIWDFEGRIIEANDAFPPHAGIRPRGSHLGSRALGGFDTPGMARPIRPGEARTKDNRDGAAV
jgi:GAF domain-containing protein